MEALSKIAVTPFIVLLKLYKLIVSPWLGERCRFSPSCADYAQESLSQHGFLRGALFTVKRIARCHPLGGEGLDPVPQKQAPRR
ncbi:MAG: membrane protein insertion efficiency factor YidD [Proteobacteria bacterium]|jgi:uncharacterized protein|nr:membrane protein insertion efficiency factor YidD [Pseudomonadota bacterium]